MRIFNLFPSTPRDLTCIPVPFFSEYFYFNNIGLISNIVERCAIKTSQRH